MKKCKCGNVILSDAVLMTDVCVICEMDSFEEADHFTEDHLYETDVQMLQELFFRDIIHTIEQRRVLVDSI